MLDLQKRFKFGGKVYTVEVFKEKFASDQDDEAIEIALKKLEESGDLVWIDELDPQTRKEATILERVQKEQTIVEAANMADEFEQQAKDFKHEQKRANQLKHKGCYFMFGNATQARDFENWVTQNLALETEISFVKGQPKLKIYDVTDQEISMMTRKYNLENGIQSVVDTADNLAQGATKAVDYTATKVLVPVAKVGAKAGVSILGTVAKTGAKTLGTLISSIAIGSKQCAKEIRNDEDVLRAGRELIQTKNELKKAVNKHTGTMGAGNMGYID